jgi:hypothetical protein
LLRLAYPDLPDRRNINRLTTGDDWATFSIGKKDSTLELLLRQVPGVDPVKVLPGRVVDMDVEGHVDR